MRLAFAGTPPFAARALEALLDAGHAVELVLTQPDRPAGRGLDLTPTAVARSAAAHGIATEKPPSLKDPQAHQRLRALRPDVLVVAAYGLVLPPAVLEIPVRGCLNIHASLLPRWRGAAPIQRALLAGDEESGISIMQMAAGLDTGPVLLMKRTPIGPRESAGSLLQRLTELGAVAIIEALARLDALRSEPQDDARATYATKASKADARIDWEHPAVHIDRQVRAFNPTPGAEARLGDDTIKVWQAEPVAMCGEPGEILASPRGGLIVACGEAALRLIEIQRPGGRRMPAAEFFRGKRPSSARREM
ncbi:MAG: methionyl-tRNA formyltransferase [Usitatibacter sp.]